MPELMLFVDGSVDPHSKIGYAAYLTLPVGELSATWQSSPIQTQRFADTSSSRIELQALLWAVRDVRSDASTLTIYTDAQTILRLPDRRARLEQAGYRAKNGSLLSNHDLYREFFDTMDRTRCRVFKVKGHLPAQSKDEIDRIFGRVDQAARAALRADGRSD